MSFVLQSIQKMFNALVHHVRLCVGGTFNVMKHECRVNIRCVCLFRPLNMRNISFLGLGIYFHYQEENVYDTHFSERQNIIW